MVISKLLSAVATLIWFGLFGYVFYVLAQRGRGRSTRISVSLALVLLVLALVASTLSMSVVVIDAGQVGVVFNIFTGTQPDELNPGLHIVIPYINQVIRYSTLEQVYTMTKTLGEGEVHGDDSLWSPTLEGLQVGIDSSTRFQLDPTKADQVHNNLQQNYIEVLIRPTIRSIVRLYVSQHTVTEVYGRERGSIQLKIEEELRKRFESEGFRLLSFDIRNVNFTDDYARSIEEKQIAQQQAEQMQYVLEREQLEAERKKIEAEGVKQAVITKAEGEAESLRLINEQIARNENLLLYRYIEKLAPSIDVMLLPSGSPFILDLAQLRGQVASPGASESP
ncbi:MAG: prohibitin family protein [Anaerolineae bacterium]